MTAEAISNTLHKRERYVERIRPLLAAVGMSEEQLNRKIDEPLQTDGGIDALGSDGLEKTIGWLDSKRGAGE